MEALSSQGGFGRGKRRPPEPSLRVRGVGRAGPFRGLSSGKRRLGDEDGVRFGWAEGASA